MGPVFFGVITALRRRGREHARVALPERLLAGRHGMDAVQGLRDWFAVCHAGELSSFVTCPSEGLAAIWRALAAEPGYDEACRHAYGEALRPGRLAAVDPAVRGDGLRRTWYLACRLEDIDARDADRLPRLFALDTVLGVDDPVAWEPSPGDDPPVRRTGGPAPTTLCAWPELPGAEHLLRRRGGAGIPP